MDFLNYDPVDGTATLRFTAAELNDLGSIIIGVQGAFSPQEAMISLGVDTARLEELCNLFAAMLHAHEVLRRTEGG